MAKNLFQFRNPLTFSGSSGFTVNNAGVNDGVGLENGNFQDFMESIKRNLAHYYTMTQLVLP